MMPSYTAQNSATLEEAPAPPAEADFGAQNISMEAAAVYETPSA
jgi:hypothetical protein